MSKTEQFLHVTVEQPGCSVGTDPGVVLFLDILEQDLALSSRFLVFPQSKSWPCCQRSCVVYCAQWIPPGISNYDEKKK